jgi:hypothetical protein
MESSESGPAACLTHNNDWKQYLEHYEGGPGDGDGGGGPFLTPVLAGNFQKASAFFSLHKSEIQFLQLIHKNNYNNNQGCVIRTSETFNTVKYALIRNTRIIRYRILCNFGSVKF